MLTTSVDRPTSYWVQVTTVQWNCSLYPRVMCKKSVSRVILFVRKEEWGEFCLEWPLPWWVRSHGRSPQLNKSSYFCFWGEIVRRFVRFSPHVCGVLLFFSLSLSLPPSTSSQHWGVLITVLALNGFLLSHSNQGQTMTLIEVKRTYARAWEQRTCIRYKLKLLILRYKLFVTVATNSSLLLPSVYPVTR